MFIVSPNEISSATRRTERHERNREAPRLVLCSAWLAVNIIISIGLYSTNNVVRVEIDSRIARPRTREIPGLCSLLRPPTARTN